MIRLRATWSKRAGALSFRVDARRTVVLGFAVKEGPKRLDLIDELRLPAGNLDCLAGRDNLRTVT
jgi:hypothetical protein